MYYQVNIIYHGKTSTVMEVKTDPEVAKKMADNVIKHLDYSAKAIINKKSSYLKDWSQWLIVTRQQPTPRQYK